MVQQYCYVTYSRKAVTSVSSSQEQHLLSPEQAATPPPSTPRLILILGGARSGKSTFAEQLAASSGQSVAFIATATAGDDEMRARIARHRASRPMHWHTIEEPLDLAAAVRHAAALADVLLLDCITLWLSNWLFRQGETNDRDMGASDPLFDVAALQAIQNLLTALASLDPRKTLIVISNEVGLGIVPAYPLGRLYRDTLGLVNQRLAGAAQRVYLLIAGIAVDIKRLHEEAVLC
jgi:adenosylcobinamide kinase / adenosylcobinamide-phosphate guanylyltransferase